jgi:hypothetical protein
MTDVLIVLTPLFVLLIFSLVRFTGCSKFGTTEASGKVEGPPLKGTPPAVTPTPPPTYEQVVAGTGGFAAHWPLEETAGNVAQVKGPLSPTADGKYVTGMPAGTGLKLGEPGAPLKSSTNNRAPEFLGTAAYVEVPFNPQLNPGNNVLGFSVEVWVKPNTAAGSTTQTVVSSRRASAQTGYDISLIRVANEPHQRVRGRVFSSVGTNVTQVTVQPTGGDQQAWRYIVLTYVGTPSGAGTLTLHVRVAQVPGWFKDGPVSAGYQSVSDPNAGTLRFASGHGGNQGPGEFFAGRIDEVAFYNSPLSQADMDKHFDLV